VTDDRQDEGEPISERDIAAALRLRPERPRVTRLSRKILIALGTVTVSVIGGVLIFALQDRKGSEQPPELYNTDQKAPADALASLPRDYTGLPRNVPPLGPPLPGDIGRPIKRAQNGGAPYAGPDPNEQRMAQEDEAARVAKVFAPTQTERVHASEPVAAPEGVSPEPASAAPVPGGAASQTDQDGKLAFLTAAVDRRTTSSDRLAALPSSYVLQAGTVIPAALITGIRSDLPGEVTAQVTENVYDSPTGRYLLVPQGTKLLGQYDSQVSFGQSRVLLVWNRLIFPSGKSIVLERQPGVDTQGYAGLEDLVDYHWGKLFTAAALSTLLGVGAELATNSNNSLANALRQSMQDTVNQTEQQIVRRQLDVQPTLTIRPGFPVRVILTRDLILEPYAG
jgi:type IV secretory pathway VirB10-like protein